MSSARLDRSAWCGNLGPVSVPAYMLSILHRQRLALGEVFVSRYASDWLVWEPGPWRPARTELQSNLESTLLPRSSAAQPARPSGEDAICFQLFSSGSAATLTVGRATSNDVVINDLTASREQFTLRRVGDAWRLEAGGSGLEIDGAPPAEGAALRSGVSITCGDVRLTFLSAEGLARRAEAFTRREPR